MKKIFITGLIIVFSGITNAQYFKKTCFYPELSVGVQGGLNYFLGEHAKEAFSLSPFGGVGYTGRFSIGYSISPVFGFRGMVGFNYHNWLDYRINFSPNRFSTETFTADLLVNLSNLKEQNPYRLYDFFLFAGGGMAYISNNQQYSTFCLLGRGGVELAYKLSPMVYLNVTGELNITGDNYNDYIDGIPVDVIPALLVGISYHFPDDKMHLRRASVRK